MITSSFIRNVKDSLILEMIKDINPKLLFKCDMREILSMTDIYTLIMLLIYSVFAIVLYPYVANANHLLYLNFFIAIALVSIAATGDKLKEVGMFRLFRRIYIVPVVYLIYSQIQSYIRVINPHDYDALLISWDKAVFGGNPTQWLNGIANPVLTEYLQACYMMFFFLPIIQGIELYRKKRDDEFFEFTRIAVFAFYLSYLLYLFFPAIGPRFTLHNFANLNNELPGVFLTGVFRDYVNTGGGIPLGAHNPAELVNRDCMPSGHTMITFVTILLAFRYKTKVRWFLLIVGSSLIFATLYLRYHYAVDVMAGLFLGLLTLFIEPKCKKAIEKLGFRQA